MNAKLILDFLKKLKKNNNKEWFDAHRKEYETAKKEFVGEVTKILDEIAKFDSGVKMLEARNCIFRINRDIRFSKDKSPYKTNFGASISPGGKKTGRAGYYIHVSPGEIFIGGGLYMPEPDILKKVRQEIDYNGKEFEKIVKSKEFKKYYGGLWEEDKLSRPPKGYDEDHPHIEYLKQRHFIAGVDLKEKDLGASFVKNAGKIYKALYPLNQFLNRAFDE